MDELIPFVPKLMKLLNGLTRSQTMIKARRNSQTMCIDSTPSIISSSIDVAGSIKPSQVRLSRYNHQINDKIEDFKPSKNVYSASTQSKMVRRNKSVHENIEKRCKFCTYFAKCKRSLTR